MKKILIFLAAMILLSFASYPVSAAGGWWNESWHFRVPVNVSFSSTASNASVNTTINFSSALSSMGVSGTFDNASIRAVENNSDMPSDFYAADSAAGTVSWIANGTTAAGTNRTFYIYFDIIENGAKSRGKIISESCSGYANACYWRSGYPNNANIWSNQSGQIGYEWNRSWAQMTELSWEWSTENGFDNAYVYKNGVFYLQKTGSGSETVQIAGSRISVRFVSDSGGISSTTDAYGTYGAAVDTIKFYPTATYTTPAFSSASGAAQKQYGPNLSSAGVSATGGWGGVFNYTVNVTDPENDDVSVTLYTNENGIWNKKSTQTTATPAVLNWTISPFSCSDIGSRNYLFEYNDSAHLPQNSSNYSQTLGKDSIALGYYSGNASVNREGSDSVDFGIRLNDTDKGAYVSGQSVSFWAYYSGTWNSIGANITASAPQGAAFYNFDPGCEVEAGAHQWKANYSGTCYVDAESAGSVFTALGQIKNYLILPPRAEYDLGTAVSIEANITDECANPLSGAGVNFSVNATGYAPVDQGLGIYNYSWNSSGKEIGNYTIQVNASKLFYNANITSWLDRFAIVAGAPQIDISLGADEATQNSTVQINASITDMSGVGLSWVRLNITYPNATVAQYDMANVSGVWISALNDTAQRGQYNITVFALDNGGKTGSATRIVKIYAKLNITLNSQDYTLEKDWFGSVYYKASDLSSALSGVNVNLSVQRPDGAELMWFSNINSYATNSYGLLNTPTFVIPAGIPSGVYQITALSSFNDSLANVVVSNSTSYNFTLYGPSGSAFSSDSVTAKIVIPAVQYIGHDLSFVALFYNSSGLADADNFTVTAYYITSQFNSTMWIAKSMSDMNRISSGVYSYSQSIAQGTSTGNYIVVLNSSVSGDNANDISAFEILQGGPFDIDVTPLEPEVSRGQTMYFDINLSNKGPVDRGDSNVTYWIGDGSRYYATAAVFVPARGNVTLRKSFTILSDEPAGIKNISVKVDYDPFYGPSSASKTFLVNDAATVAPSGASGGSGGGITSTPAPVANASNISAPSAIEIAEYPDEIEIERGWAKFITITIRTGDAEPRNVSVEIRDIPADWYEFQTAPVQKLAGNGTFLVRFAIPSTVKSGNYKAKLRAFSGRSLDEKDIIIRVFGSQDELLKYEIETIKDKIFALEARINQTKREGKDVKNIMNALEDIKIREKEAESHLNNKRYDDVSKSVKSIKELLKTLEGDLDALRKESDKQNVTPWLLFLVGGLAVILVISIIYLSRKIKSNEVSMSNRLSELKTMILGATAGAGLRNDVERTRNMILLIKKEYNEGLISKESYEELKSRNEEKLLMLEKKLHDLGLKE